MTKTYKKNPSQKQRQAMKNYIENHGNASKAMRDAGYAPNSAKNPKTLTESKAWKQLLEQYMPDEFLLQEHQKNLKQDADKGAKNKALDMSYRLKEKYPKEQTELETGDLTIKISKRN